MEECPLHSLFWPAWVSVRISSRQSGGYGGRILGTVDSFLSRDDVSTDKGQLRNRHAGPLGCRHDRVRSRRPLRRFTGEQEMRSREAENSSAQVGSAESRRTSVSVRCRNTRPRQPCTSRIASFTFLRVSSSTSDDPCSSSACFAPFESTSSWMSPRLTPSHPEMTWPRRSSSDTRSPV